MSLGRPGMRGCSRWRWPSVISFRRLVGFLVVVSVTEVWMELAMKMEGKDLLSGKSFNNGLFSFYLF